MSTCTCKSDCGELKEASFERSYYNTAYTVFNFFCVVCWVVVLLFLRHVLDCCILIVSVGLLLKKLIR